MQLGLWHAAVGSVIQEQDVVGDKNKRIFLGWEVWDSLASKLAEIKEWEGVRQDK